MRRRLVTLILFACLAGARADTSDAWADWAPLLGSWEAGPADAGGAKGGFTLERALDGKVLVRKNHAEYPPEKDRPAAVHDDLMVVYHGAGGTYADYFDSEGHVIHYQVTLTPASKKLVFLSDVQPGAPRYRLSYDYAANDTLALAFDITPPNAPDAFKTYLHATIHRAGK